MYETQEGDIISTSSGLFSMQIPPGHVWIEGDNPKNSRDSRYYGPVPIALVQGRVLAKIWPLTQTKLLRTDSMEDPSEEV